MEASTASIDPVLPSVSILVARGIFYLIGAVILTSLIWSSITRLNVVVKADGKLVPRAEPLRLSVPQGGIVSRVMVDVGTEVRAGQPILEIDSFREAADAAEDRHQVEAAKAESERYKESAGILEASTVNLKQELVNEQEALTLITQEAKELREGFDGGAVSQFEVLAKERDVADTQAHLAQLRSDLNRSEEESGQNRRLETESEQTIQAAQIKLTRDIEVKRKTILTAPTDGVVTFISSLRPGRYLAANDVAATLLPGNEPLLAEVWIPNGSMRRIKPQLPVRMMLNAYPYQQFGLLPGTIISVDPDANDAGAYRAWIKPDRLSLDGAHGPEALRTGLTLTAEIVVDQRSILDVILDPIRRVKRGFALAE
jgi:hemolysin D